MTSLAAVGSGLDIPTIVSQLVAADRAPVENRINNLGTAATAKLSALGNIKSALSNLQSSLGTLSSAITTPSFKTTVASDAGFTASTSSSAAAGNYDIEVVNLATANKLTSDSFSAEEKVGAGSLQIAFGSTSLDVTVADDMSLASLAREINRVADGKGVTASIITSDQGQHLVLSATGTGSEGAITMTASGSDRLGELAWDGSSGGMTQTVAAQDAEVIIDGRTRTGSTNTFTDLVEGVTINLTKATTGSAHNLSIAADSSTAKSSLQAFVSVYNATVSALKSSSSYNADTKKASVLTGDSMVRTLQNQLRNLVGGNNVTDLKAIGVSVGKDGTLSFDASSYDKSIAEQPNLAARLLGKDGSLTTPLQSLLKSNLDSGTGVLVQRTDSLNKQISKLEKELDELDLRMDKVYDRYTAQFTSMDSLVASMQSTSNYLTTQLANLSSSKK
jgi:flagellar hook-associated protein 2